MTQQHPIAIASLLNARLPTTGYTKLVAIDGHGGAGKSTLADLLADALEAEIVHTDDFASWDNPKDWWPVLIEQVLSPIADGARTLTYARSTWWPGHNREPIVNQQVTPVVILEGVSSLRQEFRHYLTLGVFINEESSAISTWRPERRFRGSGSSITPTKRDISGTIYLTHHVVSCRL